MSQLTDFAILLARRIDGTGNDTAQNLSDTLLALTEHVETVERALASANADCVRLANERDEMRRMLVLSGDCLLDI